MSTEIAKYTAEDYNRPQPLAVVKAMGKSMQYSIEQALPAFMKGQAQAILRAAYTEITKNPKLLDCTPMSLFSACINAAQLGLQLGGFLGQAYLIPFKNNVTLIPGYKGYIQLVNRSGQVGIMHAETVWEGDEYEVTKGSNPSIRHIPHEPKTLKEMEQRKPIAFYATVMTDRGAVFQTMTVLEGELHRARFAMRKGGGPWWEHFPSMCMKTCIIRLCKYLPMSAESMNNIAHAVAIDQAADAGQPQGVIDITKMMKEIPNDPAPNGDAPPVDNRPDEEKEPESLPDAAKSPAQKVEEKVKNAKGPRKPKDNAQPALIGEAGAPQSKTTNPMPD